jgi:hypothetical protein
MGSQNSTGGQITKLLTKTVPLQQRAAQHRFRRQSAPPGLARIFAPQIARYLLTSARWPSSQPEIALSSQPIWCPAKTSNIVARTVRS